MKINIKKYKEQLESEKNLLVEELSSLGKMDIKTGDWEATPIVEEIQALETDDADKADHFEDYEERSATLNTLESRLRNVNLALKKIISKNNYGICEICQKSIEQKRLDANSAARTCIEHREVKLI